MMNQFKVITPNNAGYKYIELIDTSKPSIWLGGNSYRFNKVIISRKPEPIVRKYK